MRRSRVREARLHPRLREPRSRPDGPGCHRLSAAGPVRRVHGQQCGTVDCPVQAGQLRLLRRAAMVGQCEMPSCRSASRTMAFRRSSASSTSISTNSSARTSSRCGTRSRNFVCSAGTCSSTPTRRHCAAAYRQGQWPPLRINSSVQKTSSELRISSARRDVMFDVHTFRR